MSHGLLEKRVVLLVVESLACAMQTRRTKMLEMSLWSLDHHR